MTEETQETQDAQEPVAETLPAGADASLPPDGLRPGGLMRCCLMTLNSLYPAGPARIATEGQTLQCRYSSSPNHRMIFRDGAWEWDRDASEPDKVTPG